MTVKAQYTIKVDLTNCEIEHIRALAIRANPPNTSWSKFDKFSEALNLLVTEACRKAIDTHEITLRSTGQLK